MAWSKGWRWVAAWMLAIAGTAGAEAPQTAAVAELPEVVVTALRSETARTEVPGTVHVVDRDALQAARLATRLARHRYSAGLIDFQTVLDTERTVLTVEDKLTLSEADGAKALIQLYKALGGGWSSTPATYVAVATGTAP